MTDWQVVRVVSASGCPRGHRGPANANHRLWCSCPCEGCAALSRLTPAQRDAEALRLACHLEDDPEAPEND